MDRKLTSSEMHPSEELIGAIADEINKEIVSDLRPLAQGLPICQIRLRQYPGGLMFSSDDEYAEHLLMGARCPVCLRTNELQFTNRRVVGHGETEVAVKCNSCTTEYASDRTKRQSAERFLKMERVAD